LAGWLGFVTQYVLSRAFIYVTTLKRTTGQSIKDLEILNAWYLHKRGLRHLRKRWISIYFRVSIEIVFEGQEVQFFISFWLARISLYHFAPRDVIAIFVYHALPIDGFQPFSWDNSDKKLSCEWLKTIKGTVRCNIHYDVTSVTY